MRTVVSVLVEHFRKWEISHVFGVPGKAVVPLILELGDQGVSFVLARHETGAGFAATGYSLTKNTLGVAMGTSGPGGTNLLTAAGQAKADHLPVLIITGHPSMRDTGKALGQDSTFYGTDLVQMFQSVTLFSARLERGDLLKSYLVHAMEKAFLGVRGPVHLSIPYDVFTEKIDPFFVPLPSLIPAITTSNLDQVIADLNNAKRPVLFLGKGVHISKAYNEVRSLAERFQIPVMTTPGGKGTFPSHHPLSLGAFGLGGTMEASDYLRSGVDLMVVVGTKLSDMSISGMATEMYPQKMIQFEINQTFAGKSLPVPTQVVLGDAKDNLKKLLDNNGLQIAHRMEVASSLDQQSLSEETRQMDVSDSKYITAVQALKTMRKCLPDDAIVIADDGSHGYYALRYFDIIQPGTFYFDDFFACMGHAIGYAVGAKIATPNQTIVCLTGDGCLFMHGSEISTAVNEHAPVIFIVFNNGMLDMVNKGMYYNLGRTDGTVYRTPLKVKGYAESMGAQAFCCRNAQELEDALCFALIQISPTVIEVMVDPGEIPPTMARG